jgi:hypothetical protein
MEELNKQIHTIQWFEYRQNSSIEDLLAISFLDPLPKDSFLPFSNASE